MIFEDFITKVLKGKSVNSVAKKLNIPQRSFDDYCKGKTIPGWSAAKAMAEEADISLEEVFKMLAEEERNRKSGSQADRALGYEPRGRGFDSCQPHHL